MADNFLGEIRAVPFNFPPKGWAFCDGQLLSIAQNTALFALLGTQFGGDGKTTFALPNLQGQVALGYGHGAGLSAYTMGQSGGMERVALDEAEIPSHRHNLTAVDSLATSTFPSKGFWGVAAIVGKNQKLYGSPVNAL